MKRSAERIAAVVGAAALLAVGVDALSVAATGNGVVLGHVNSANKTTTIKNTGSGAPLNLVTKKSTQAPFTTNAKGLVKNLNAATVGGLTAPQIGAKSAWISPSGGVTVSTGGFTVTHPVTGLFCVSVAGVNAATHPATLSTDYASDSTSVGTPGNIAYAEFVRTSPSCGSTNYEVQTYEVIPGAGGSTAYHNQGFSILVP